MKRAALTLCGDGTGTAGEEVMETGVSESDDDDEETIADEIVDDESAELVEFW